MSNLLRVPVSSIIALSAEQAVTVLRAILQAECGYAKVSTTLVTISSRLTTADGGIDAEANFPDEVTLPTDSFFRGGLTGFQLKSGTSFKPWTTSAIRGELLDRRGKLFPEVERLAIRGGRYSLLCTGHDLTPEQRNDSRENISAVLAEAGYSGYADLVEVLGASQLADIVERYPGTASLLASDPIEEAWVLEEWQRDAHMVNPFVASPEQEQLIEQIRAQLRGNVKHIRVLGEPGLGKTRLVLEAVTHADLANYVLYVQHGSKFGQTRLFRQLLKSGSQRPLILVIDELPEFEMAEIWRALKLRCGSLKIVTIDHGTDESHDEEIFRVAAAPLPDESIKKIIGDRIAGAHDLDRWVAICAGSPRVAQAVADNLRANPDDILRPPASVPIWTRFLHGYGTRSEIGARQIDCVTQHLALFSRFGYEAPVGEEAEYIAEQILKVDATIGWARFQEIVRDLRARRVLQGSRTLFFVPKALHIYLWRQFWERYGRGFDFARTFAEMPASLHAWFLNMFKFAGGSSTAHVIDGILKCDGFFADRDVLVSEKGSRFLSILAEANPAAVLRLLEASIGKWTNEEIFDFKDNRQNLVWTLEKIAVWSTFTVRAAAILARFAVNENSNYSNNSTGTFIGLFRIGPEAAATEAEPKIRLPALVKLLRSQASVDRRLALKALGAALDRRGSGFRIVGPEHQGLRERAKLWIPVTYGDWWEAQRLYFETLINETEGWPAELRPEVCLALLNAVEEQLRNPASVNLALKVLDDISQDSAMAPNKINAFFSHWREYGNDGKRADIASRLYKIERRYTRRDLRSRVQRYVIDVDWLEWSEELTERRSRPYRAKKLVAALARRIATRPESFGQIKDLLSPDNYGPALWFFGEQLALNDEGLKLLHDLVQVTSETRNQGCVQGYLSVVRGKDQSFYQRLLHDLIQQERLAWLAASIALRAPYDDVLFEQCLRALDRDWITPQIFRGVEIATVPAERANDLLYRLFNHRSAGALVIIVELLDALPFKDPSPFTPAFVFEVVTRSIPVTENRNIMRSYHWKNVCMKLIAWDIASSMPLLDRILDAMRQEYRLSYDSDSVSVADQLVRINPSGAWSIIKKHFEHSLPKWRGDLFGWLKGGMAGFDETKPTGAVANLPVAEILNWIDENPVERSELVGHFVLPTLVESEGGRLTRELLLRYSEFKGVANGISASFHSGGWSGPTSIYLRGKRDTLRSWLASESEFEIINWLEIEIDYIDRRIEREEIDEERSTFD